MKQLLLAVIGASTILTLAAAPVSAAMPAGAYARFNLMEEEGLVFLSYTGATTVNAGVLGLLSSQEYFLQGSSQNCGHMPSSANKVFRIKGTTDSDGVLWLRSSAAIDLEIHSVWLGPTDGSEPPVCERGFNFKKDKSGFPTGVIGISGKGNVLSLLVRRPNDQARLTLVIDGGAGDDMVTVRGVDRPCGEHQTQRFFDIPAELRASAAFQTETLSMTAEEMGMIRSERAVFDTHRECANIIAVLIG